jgi:hypothetical protein
VNRYLQNLIKTAVIAGLMVLSAGIAMPLFGATATVDVDVNIRPSHNIAPDSITNLSSLTADYSSVGEEKIDLSWTAPQTYAQTELLGYQVRWSTNSLADLLNDTTAWWNQAGGIDDLTYLHSPGTPANDTISNLIPAATYYFAIKAVDAFYNISDMDFKTKSGTQAYAMASIDNIAPDAIANLSALAGGVGEIELSWSAPGDDGAAGNITGGEFIIQYSSYSDASDKGGWNADNYDILIPTTCASASQHSYTVTGLADFTIYYFRVWTADDRSNISGESNAAFALTSTVELTEPINTLTGRTDNSIDGGVELEWISVGSGHRYILKYATFNVLAGDTTAWWNQAQVYLERSPSSVKGSTETESIYLNLTPADTYYFSVRAVNIYGSTSPVGNIAEVIVGDKIPDPPQNLTLTLEDNKVKVDWNANTEPDINAYDVLRSTLQAGPYEVVFSTSKDFSVYYDTNVVINTRYWYKIRVRDDTGNENECVEKDIFVGEITAVLDVEFIKVSQVTSGSLTITWEQTPGNIKGYRIERSDDIEGTWSAAGFVYSTNTLTYTVPVVQNVYCYRIRTESQFGTMSSGSMIIDTSEEINHIYCSQDYEVWVKVPDSFADELETASAKIEFVKADESGFIAAYDIKAMAKGERIKDFRFDKTRMGAEIVISHNVAPGEDASFFWYNGIEWIKLGGDRDEKGRLYIKSRRLGKYGVKDEPASDEFVLTAVVPRIFTPDLPYAQNPVSNGTTVEVNAVHFYFENPHNAEVSINIYNITGARVRGSLRSMGSDEMVWDGKDDSGKIVRGGIYLYQVEADSKVFNGTIVVAK